MILNKKKRMKNNKKKNMNTITTQTNQKKITIKKYEHIINQTNPKKYNKKL